MSHTPEELARRLDYKAFDAGKIRDSIAASLPQRWAEFALSLEAFRYSYSKDDPIEAWTHNNKNGRAFYLYIVVCHYTPDVKPDASVFCAFFRVWEQDDSPALRTSYYRMFNDWTDRGWIDKDGVPTEAIIRESMRRMFEIMMLPTASAFVSHAQHYLNTISSRERDEVLEKGNSTLAQRLDKTYDYNSDGVVPIKKGVS